MIRGSKEMNNTISAYEKGYRVTRDGIVVNPSGSQIVEMIGNSNGMKYKRFGIRLDTGERVCVYTHKLQAYQKYGDEIFDVESIRHLNGNSLDNSFDNIAKGSRSENMMDVPEDIRMERAINATKSVTKYNNTRDEIVAYYNICRSYSETMKHFGISSKGTLYYILHNSYKN